jgi:hypothetical protein
LVTSAKPQVTLSSNGDDTSLRAEAGFQHGEWLLSLKVEQEIEKGQTEATFVDLDGLSPGSKATFKATRVGLGAFDPTGLISTCNEFNKEVGPSQPIPLANDPSPYEKCAAALRQRPEPWPTRIDDAEAEAVAATCAEFNKTGAALLLPKGGVCTVIKTTREALPDDDWRQQLDKKVGEARKKLCEEFNSTQPASWGWILTRGSSTCLFSTLEQKGSKWVVKAAKATNFSPRYFSLAASTQQQTFKFTDKAAPNIEKPTEESKFAVAISSEVGRLWYKSAGKLYLGASGSITRAYKGADAVEVCQLLENTNAAQCIDIALAGPEEKNAQRVSVEARFLPWGMKIGFLPRVSYEFSKHVTTGQLITYFLTDEAKGLNGGVEFAIRNDGKGPLARLFIGMSFDVFPGQIR